ncbi:MAG: PIN domain-containing protein [Actinomycetota bacterium]|nr:PIN domain-containing protein [Actinomycetota bacterium]
MSGLLLDTSILVGADDPGRLRGAISAASLAELYFGALAAGDPEERAHRTQRLGVIESAFDPFPLDETVAREWGRLAAAVAARGGQPRRRTMDLAIAATANVQGVPLLTVDTADLAIVGDLVSLRIPE